VSVAQRELDAPLVAEPLVPLPIGLPVVLPVLPPMPVLLLPTPLPVLVPALLPVVPLPMLPLGLDEVCANAPRAKRDAAVALTKSFKLMKCSCN
jgi:hypothetical protein